MWAISIFPDRRTKGAAKAFLAALLLAGFSASAQDLSQIGKGKPFTVSGSIGVEGAINGQSGYSPVPPLNDYGLNAALNFNIYGWSVPLSATFYNRSLSYSQPFQRYGLSPTYKWITLHAGWRSVAFSPLVFNGVNFFGGGIELNPGKFRFGAVYGEFNKALAEDTSRNRPSDFATYSFPTYRRTGYALKLGFGSQKSFFDLVFFQAKDDPNSIPRPVVDRFRRPQQNTAGSIVYQQSMGKYLTLRFNGAVSIYTYDMQADTLPKGFTSDIAGFNSVQPLRLSTQLGYAGDVSLAYKSRQFDLRATYRQLSPFYQCMGIYSRLQDVQEIRLDGAYRSKNHKFFGNAGFGTDANNIAKTKIATTRRYNLLLNGNYEFTEKFGANLGYNFYTQSQVKQFSGLPDTLLTANAMHNINAGARYTTTNASAMNNVLLAASFQTGTAGGLNMAANDYQNYFLSLNDNYTLLQSRLSLNGGLNAFGSSGYGATSYSVGANAGASRPFLKDQLTTSANLGYYQNFSNYGNGNSITAGIQLGYRPGKRHAFSLGGNYTFNHSAYADYSVYRVQSSYVFTF